MGKLSRRKGKTGELEVVHLYQGAGIQARRSAGTQSQGGRTSEPDVIVPPNLPLWTEVKRGGVTAQAALRQAEESAPADRLPVAFSRSDGDKWLVSMRPNLFFHLLLHRWPEAFSQKELFDAPKDSGPEDLAGDKADPDGDASP